MAQDFLPLSQFGSLSSDTYRIKSQIIIFPPESEAISDHYRRRWTAYLKPRVFAETIGVINHELALVELLTCQEIKPKPVLANKISKGLDQIIKL